MRQPKPGAARSRRATTARPLRRCRRALAGLTGVLALAVVGTSQAAAVPTLGSPTLTGRVKSIPTTPLSAPPPTTLSRNGERPDVLVDAAGTSHIVWNEPGQGGPDVTVYCRLPRAAKACDVTQRLVPPGADALSQDPDGPQVFAVNDQVVIVSHRYPQEVPKPGGAGSPSDTLYQWSSDDGGRTFLGPGIVASTGVGLGGNAKGFGPDPNNPSLGFVTGDKTGGVVFTGVSGGRFQGGGALLAEGDFGGGRLAVDAKGIPTVAYHDLGTTSFLRTWTGQGDVNDAATWTPPQSFPGLDPDIAVAGGRLVATDARPDGSGDVELRDLATGAARVLNTGQVGNSAIPIGHPDGTVSVIWQGVENNVRGVWRRDRIGPSGAITGTPSLVSTEEGLFLSADATDDGGGVAVRDTVDKHILLSAFGTTIPTGRKGLGGADGGGGLPADVAVEGQKLQVGGGQVLLQDGLFQTGIGRNIKVSEGPVSLNGLVIVPDANVQVQIDLKAKTIRSTGTVSVLLRAPGIPDVTLFRGVLNLDLNGKGVGDSIGEFAESVFKPVLLGFPLRGDIDIKLAPPDGVRIPISLQLPVAAFGDIRGAAELLANNRDGLVVKSLDFSADGAKLGPALIRRLRVQYRTEGGTALGDCLVPPSSGAPLTPPEWAGVFELQVPPLPKGPTVCGSIRFGVEDGFRAATFRVDLPYPGIVLFPGLSLTSLGGGLQLQPVKRIDGRFRIEAAGAAPDVSAAQFQGGLSVEFGDPLKFEGDGTLTAAGLTLGTGKATINTDGYATLHLESGPRFGPFRVAASVNGFADGARREFSLYGKGEVCFVNDLIPGGELCLPGSEGTISTKGVAACLPAIHPLVITVPTIPPVVVPVPRGAGFTFGDDEPDVWWGTSCYASRYQVPDAHASALGDPPVAEAQTTVQGTGEVTFRVSGAGGVPDVDLIGPNGQAVAPDVDAPDPSTTAHYLVLKSPVAGTYTIRARPGSPLIAEVALSRSEAAPAATNVKVSGRGRTRTLSYRASFTPDQGIMFAERGPAGSRTLGAAVKGAGRLTFTPGPGPGGRRDIVALLMQDGIVHQDVVVGSYVAPPPPRVGRASGLRVRRAGTGVVVTWRAGQAAAAQRLVAQVPGGPLVTRILSGTAHSATVPGIDGRIVRVSVTALGSNGRAGPTARASLAAAKHPPAKQPAGRSPKRGSRP
jgi:hypothetical protein